MKNKNRFNWDDRHEEYFGTGCKPSDCLKHSELLRLSNWGLTVCTSGGYTRPNDLDEGKSNYEVTFKDGGSVCLDWCCRGADRSNSWSSCIQFENGNSYFKIIPEYGTLTLEGSVDFARKILGQIDSVARIERC